MRNTLLLTAVCTLAAGQLMAQCAPGETEVTVGITLDRYGSETTWEATGPGGSPVYASGGPYTDATTNGEYPQPDVTFCVADGSPVELHVDDAYGDGICCAYGEGGITLTAVGFTLVNLGAFGESAEGACVVGGTELAAEKINMYDYLGQGNQTISGVVRNLGTVPVTSFTLTYSIDGGSGVSETITGTVNPGQTYTFSHSTPWDAVFGTHDVAVTATMPNGAADIIATNDEQERAVNVASQIVDRTTLIEEFTSSTCPPCESFNASFDPILTDLNTNSSGSNVAAIKYQMNWPSPGNDPSYNPDGNTRKSYYAVTGIPSPWIDGRAMLYGTEDEVTGATDAPAPVDLQLAATRDGNTVTVFATVTPYINVSGTNKLHIVVTEDYYEYVASTTGQDEYHYAERKMLPNGQGTNLGALENNVSQTFTYSYTMIEGGPAQGNYNLWGTIEGITVVAFVQSGNKTIFQAGLSEAPVGISENSDVLGLSIYPNPSTGLVYLNSKTATGLVTVDVFNALGARVAAESFNVSGTRTMDFSSLNDGVYYMMVNANGHTSTRKLTIAR